MAKFNQSTHKKSSMNVTTNHEGTTVHQLTALETLFSKVLGSMFGESTFYEKRSAEADYQKLIELIDQIPSKDKEYALKIAELGRYYNMIQMPLEVLSVAYHTDEFKGTQFMDANGHNKLSYYNNLIVRRMKDITEILAAHFAMHNGEAKNMPKQMRKNLKHKLESFDKYKISKGLGNQGSVKVADAIKLLHPKASSPDMYNFYTEVIRGNVTLGHEKKQIQTELTRLGQNKTTEKVTTDLKKSLYDANLQALIRQLINLYKNGIFEDAEALNYTINKLTTKQDVIKSKLLPYQFYTAYRELDKLGNTPVVVRLKEAVQDALDLAVENVDVIEGTTAILIDRSGSMEERISSTTNVNADEMAMLLGAIAYKRGFGDLFVFSNDCKRIDASRKTPIFELVKQMRRAISVGGTDLKKALNTITKHAQMNKVSYDNLIILSDNDCYGYDKSTNVLKFGERYFGFGYKADVNSPDEHVTKMIKDGIIKKVWINNLLGNDFAIVNTNSHTKNLITGFSEKFINIINVYGYIGTGKNTKQLIDLLLEKERNALLVSKR